MKGYNTLYYLLFVILIMGAFASMAQNSYGQKILGGVAIAFAILFIVQFIDSVHKKKNRSIYTSIELACLFVISIIFALRIFYISFPDVEVIFGLALLTLILLYFKKMMNNFSFYRPKNNFLSFLILIFYCIIIFYFLSLGSIAFLPEFSIAIGMVAFALLIVLIIAGLMKRKILVDGENTSVLKTVTRIKDNSILILALFLLFTLYRGFTTTGILPKIYSDEFPQAYFELVNKAESGKEKPEQGKYKYQEFKENYDRFVKQSQ